MRIAQISPLYESVPPKFYGGTERVVSYITEELLMQGHEPVLFASGDSLTGAKLVPVCTEALRLAKRCNDPVAHHFMMMEEVLRREADFDIIHSHIDYIGFVLARRASIPVVSTIHGRLDFDEHSMVLSEYDDIPLVSISDAQRTPVPFAGWVATVYHGLPAQLYTLQEKKEDYLAFVGRISPEKKVESAINIAIESEMPLTIAAKVDRQDVEYFDAAIRPLLDHPLIQYVGEVNDSEKNDLIGRARAYLHPVDWPEPFGLVMIEAMACGTPVIARRRGSIPEIVEHGVTGFIFQTDEEAVDCIKKKVPFFSAAECRKRFEERFTSERMVKDYLKIYGSFLERGGKCLRSAG